MWLHGAGVAVTSRLTRMAMSGSGGGYSRLQNIPTDCCASPLEHSGVGRQAGMQLRAIGALVGSARGSS